MSSTIKICSFSLLCVFIDVVNAIVLDSSLLEGKIVGGCDATNYELKYMASIQIKENSASDPNNFVWKHYCGAGAIGLNVLLTSATCVHYVYKNGYSRASVMVGTLDLSKGERRINIQQMDHHRLFYADNPRISSKNDYGVILLEENVFSETEFWLLMDKVKSEPSFSIIAGWGCDVMEDKTVTFDKSCVSNILRKVKLVQETSKICRAVFQKSSFKNVEICAYAAKNEGISLRDLGSPLVRVVEENGQNYNYVIGIATDFIMHESGYQYVRFVRISPVKDKIEEMINKLIAESSQQCSEPSTTDLDMPNSS